MQDPIDARPLSPRPLNHSASWPARAPAPVTRAARAAAVCEGEAAPFHSHCACPASELSMPVGCGLWTVQECSFTLETCPCAVTCLSERGVAVSQMCCAPSQSPKDDQAWPRLRANSYVYRHRRLRPELKQSSWSMPMASAWAATIIPQGTGSLSQYCKAASALSYSTCCCLLLSQTRPKQTSTTKGQETIGRVRVHHFFPVCTPSKSGKSAE
jgi:hypothetical protein